MTRIGVGLLLMVAVMLPVWAVVVRHDVPMESYAELARQGAFGGVVNVVAGSGVSGRSGSGILLNNEWVATAAHVVWERPISSLRIRCGEELRVVESVRVPDEWRRNPGVGLGQGADLALLRLASPVRYESLTALAVGSLYGETTVMLGSGRSGKGVLGAIMTGGEFLGAMNVIDRQLAVAGGGLLVTDFDGGLVNQNSLNGATVDRRYYDDGSENPLLSEVLLSSAAGSEAGFAGHVTAGDLFPGLPAEFLEGTTAAGDSGGPWFVLNRRGGWDLAGLTSWGVNPISPEGFARGDSRYGDVSFATDLTVHREWIMGIVPEPAAGWFGLLAMTLGLRRCRSNRLASGR